MNQDFKDLISIFNAQSVKYLVVGAHALAAYGYVRATKDIDLWVEPNHENASKVFSALKDFGAPLTELTVEDLKNPDLIFQMGVPPVRIDILTSISGLSFDEAWSNRTQTKFAGEPIAVLSKDHLITNKKASGRKQDLLDIEVLKSLDRQ